MNHTTSIADSAMNQCAKSIAVLTSLLKVMAFTLLISSYTQSVDN